VIHCKIRTDIVGTRIRPAPTEYEDRTTPEGKTSSEHWIRFAFKLVAITRFRSGKGRVVLAKDFAWTSRRSVSPLTHA
jgi:hypothetical protein